MGLLVVIAIIAVLVALPLPALSATKGKAGGRHPGTVRFCHFRVLLKTPVTRLVSHFQSVDSFTGFL